MATELDTLIVKLAADTAQMRGELAKATTAMAREMQKQAKEVEKVNAALEKVGSRIKQAIGGALAGLSVAKLASMTRESLKWAESIEQQAKWIGISTNALEAYEQGARMAGVETGKMGQALEKMIGNLADASADPNSGPAKIFQQLGLNVKQANQDVDAFLGKLADKIATLSKNDKLIVGKTLFGDKMDDVVRVFEGGAAGLAKMRAEFDKMNPGFADAVKRGAEMNRQYEAMTRQIDTQLKTVLIELGPVLLELLGIVNSLARGFATMARDSGLIKGTLSQRQADLEEKIKAAESNPNKDFTMNRDRLADLRRQREALLEDRANEAAWGDAGKFAPPKKDKPDIIKTGGESELEKKLRELREAASEARAELSAGPRGAAWEKLYLDILRLPGGVSRLKEAFSLFNQQMDTKGLVVLKEYGQETEQIARIAAAEATGRKDLVAVLELEFSLRQKFGDKFVEANRAQIEQLAKQRFAVEENVRLTKVGMDTLEEIGRSAFSGLTSAVLAFGDQNETVWKRIGNVAINTLNQIANKILELGVINPMLNSLLGGNRDTLGGILGAVFGAGQSALGGSGGILSGLTGGTGSVPMSFLGFAEGGNPPVDRWSLVGEKGPELIRPRAPMTVIPNNAMGGGGTVNLYGSPDSTVRIADLEAGLRSVGMQVKVMRTGERDRVLGYTSDASRRGGSFATAMGR